MHAPHSRPLRILHVVRAPVGGLFRHVCDLARGQSERGHSVGLIADSSTGGAAADTVLAALAPQLTLGVSRIPIARDIGASDVVGLARMFRIIRAASPDVLHGHGAKGGACARLAPAQSSTIRVYTPHGGSLHYRPGTLGGALYGTLERLLMPRTDLFLFESAYARGTFVDHIGVPTGIARVVCNGVGEAEFAPVTPAADATDFVFVGELRRLKGVDLLLDALASLRQSGRHATLTIVGEGPDGAGFRAQAARLDLADIVRFAGYRPAREAFALGRILVMPSRNESLPYVVLEAAAAGVPIIASHVGGIPEIFGPQAICLVPPEDSAALARAVGAAIEQPAGSKAAAATTRERVRQLFSLDAMVGGVLDGYREALTPRFLAAQ
ncbi:MAG: glycosyltransferase [Rhizobiales bacterium]|nr:glycosyltransferase [Hyphomicrobiales bacterium]